MVRAIPNRRALIDKLKDLAIRSPKCFWAIETMVDYLLKTLPPPDQM